GVEPETLTKQLYQEILRQRPSQTTSGVESTAAVLAAPAPEGAGRGDDTPPRELALVGREAEMTRLRESLDASWAGRGRVVAVIGEGGRGHDARLARAAAAR